VTTALHDCAADTAALFHGDDADRMIDRMWNMDFLADQLFTYDDTFSLPFHEARHRDAVRYNYFGYII
jgi:hypothetical protein